MFGGLVSLYWSLFRSTVTSIYLNTIHGSVDHGEWVTSVNFGLFNILRPSNCTLNILTKKIPRVPPLDILGNILQKKILVNFFKNSKKSLIMVSESMEISILFFEPFPQISFKTVICLTKYVNCVAGAVQCRQSSFIIPNMVTIIGLTTFKSFSVTCAFLRIVSLMILLQRTLLHYI